MNLYFYFFLAVEVISEFSSKYWSISFINSHASKLSIFLALIYETQWNHQIMDIQMYKKILINFQSTTHDIHLHVIDWLLISCFNLLVVLCPAQQFLKEFSFLTQVLTGLHPNEKLYKLLIYIGKLTPWSYQKKVRNVNSN
jgi:hypothetical protein